MNLRLALLLLAAVGCLAQACAAEGLSQEEDSFSQADDKRLPRDHRDRWFEITSSGADIDFREIGGNPADLVFEGENQSNEDVELNLSSLSVETIQVSADRFSSYLHGQADRPGTLIFEMEYCRSRRRDCQDTTRLRTIDQAGEFSLYFDYVFVTQGYSGGMFSGYSFSPWKIKKTYWVEEKLNH